jgi:hypothetical protein
MEDVLEVYQLPYDPDFPVVCMDESSKQLVGEVAAPIPMAPGHGQIIDREYVRNGVAEIFVEVEPLAGKRHVEITERRTRKDWAHFIKGMLDERYPNAVKVRLVMDNLRSVRVFISDSNAVKVRLVMDNLNTHDVASFYEAFDPAEAKRLAGRLEIHYTPKHGSWLNIAEIELSALQSQCMNRRIPSREHLQNEVSAWESDRNTRGAPIHWRFTNENARIKLTRLYPKL